MFLTLLKIRTLDFLLVGLCLTYKYPLSLGAAGLWLWLLSGSDNSISSPPYRDILIFSALNEIGLVEVQTDQNWPKRCFNPHFSSCRSFLSFIVWWDFPSSNIFASDSKKKIVFCTDFYHQHNNGNNKFCPIKYSDHVHKCKQFLLQSLAPYCQY